jgi:hypothetical protein
MPPRKPATSTPASTATPKPVPAKPVARPPAAGYETKRPLSESGYKRAPEEKKAGEGEESSSSIDGDGPPVDARSPEEKKAVCLCLCMYVCVCVCGYHDADNQETPLTAHASRACLPGMRARNARTGYACLPGMRARNARTGYVYLSGISGLTVPNIRVTLTYNPGSLPIIRAHGTHSSGS